MPFSSVSSSTTAKRSGAGLSRRVIPRSIVAVVVVAGVTAWRIFPCHQSSRRRHRDPPPSFRRQRRRRRSLHRQIPSRSRRQRLSLLCRLIRSDRLSPSRRRGTPLRRALDSDLARVVELVGDVDRGLEAIPAPVRDRVARAEVKVGPRVHPSFGTLPFPSTSRPSNSGARRST
jgi:hypothetical protein